MLTIYKAKDRFHTRIGWLDSWHSFSFDQHYDPKRMGFGALRVLNDDTIAPHQGFGTHSHANMEIVTIVLDGELTHKDSMGNEGKIIPGDVQRMSVGTGVRHSEMNMSSAPVHLLQLWIEPKQKGIPPSYEQREFRLTKNEFSPIVSGDRAGGSLYLHQDATLLLGDFEKGKRAAYAPQHSYVFLFVIGGRVAVNGHEATAGDAVATNEKLVVEAVAASRVLVLDLPPSTSNL